MTRDLASTSRGPRARRGRVVGWSLLLTLLVAGLAVLLGGRGGFALWNDARVTDSGNVATGTVDIVSAGPATYAVGATAFNPATDRLFAGQTLTITIPTMVRVTGTTADPSLSLTGLTLPPELAGKATISSSATPVSVSDTNQAATVTITLAANTGASFNGEVVDLSAVLLHLASGSSWRDEATLGLANVTMNDLPEMDITYDTTMSGATTSIKVPVSGRTGTMVIDWGDGNLQPITADLPTHTYSPSGTYTARIYGRFSNYGSGDSGVLASNKSVKSVSRWDANGVTNLSRSFQGANNLVSVVAPPSTINDLSYAFFQNTGFNGSLASWDTSNVKKMFATFNGATAYNQPLSDWNTGNVTDMAQMFMNSKYNASIAGWNTQNVKDMGEMFHNNPKFNQPIEGWNISSLTGINGMFQAATAFNQPLAGWNTGSVANMYMAFNGASSFNQPIGNWDTRKATNMAYMFLNSGMTQDLSAWTVDLIPTMPTAWSPPSFPQAKWPLPWQSQMQITFNTTLPGVSSTSVIVPISGRSGLMMINWGDNTPVEKITADLPTHTYAASGTYTAKVFGTFSHYGSSDAAVRNSNKAIQSVGRWDANGVTSLSSAFSGANNLTSVVEAPHTVTDMTQMFENAWVYNQDISAWDVSRVLSFDRMFGYASAFNQPIGLWDTSGATSMQRVFWHASVFNQPLAHWNTAGVTNMYQMFNGATKFNQPIGNWDTSKVTNMTDMFSGATAMDADLSAWTVDLIPTMPANWKPTAGYPMAKWPLPWQSYTMLVTYDTTLLDVPGAIMLPISGRSGPMLINWGDGTPSETITADLPSHTYVTAGSHQARIYGQFTTFGSTDAAVLASNKAIKSVDRWDANGVTSVADGFSGASNLLSVVEPPHTVTNMSSVFEGASSYNQDISGWNTSAVTNMNRMFADAAAFNQPLGTWNTTVVADMTGMFSGATAMDADLSAWTVELIPSMPANWKPTAGYPIAKWPLPWQQTILTIDTRMSGATTAFKLPISGRTGAVTVDWGDGTAAETVAADYPTHTYSTSGLYTVTVTGKFSRFGVETIVTPDHKWPVSEADFMIASNKTIKSVDRWGSATLSSLSLAFYQANNLTAVAAPPATVTDFSWMFDKNTGFSAPITGWDTSHVTTMRGMFNEATSFNQNLSGWDTSQVTDFYWLFRLATSFNQPVNTWDTRNVTNMGNVFNAAYVFNQPVDNWNTSNVTDMSAAFFNAWKFNRPLATWDVSKVTDFNNMFHIAKVFNQDISGWDTSKATDMSSMFEAATAFNQPIGTWNTSQVTNMVNMFNGASAMTADLSAWTVDLIPLMPSNWKPTAGYPMAKWPFPWQPTLVTYDTALTATPSIKLPIGGFTGTVRVDWGDGTAVQVIAGDLPTHTYSTGASRQVKIYGKFATFGSDDPDVLTSNQGMTSVNYWNRNPVASLASAFRGADNLVSIATPPATVTDLSYAFADNTTFNASLDGWDVSNVTNLKGMFSGASVFNQPLNGWDTSKVTSMASMFADARAFDQPLDQWSTATVTDMTNMFAGQTVMSQDLSDWTVDLMPTMPTGWSPPSFPDTKWPLPWQPTRITYDTTMPSGTTNIKIPISGLTGTVQIDWGDGSAVQTIVADMPTHTYAAGTHQAKIYGAFSHYGSSDSAVLTSNKSLKSVDHWSRNGITSLNLAFRQADNLVSVAVPPSSVTDMSYTFYQNARFNGPVNDWDTSNVTTMKSMFDSAYLFNQPLDKWDTSRVTNMRWMFVRAYVFNQSIGGWNTGAVTDMESMFEDAHAFNQNISAWNTGKAVDMYKMFLNATVFNQPIGTWNTQNVTNMATMFSGANAMTADLSAWTVDKIPTMPTAWSPPNYPQEKWPLRWQPVAPTGVMVNPVVLPADASASASPTTSNEPTATAPTSPAASDSFAPTSTATAPASPAASDSVEPTPTPTPSQPSGSLSPSAAEPTGPTPTPTQLPTPTPAAVLSPTAKLTTEDGPTATPTPTPTEG